MVHPIVGPSLYFCVPPNPKLLGYWDTVADRLFKIRHCQNLAGIVRQLPLFEPPIDPALLVRAAAAGVDIRAALSDVNAPLPIYRFSVLAQRAMELSNEVRALGGALLSALEKKDAETIALLRSGHEVTMQSRIAEVRQQQADEASASLDAMRTSRTLAEEREAYYRRLIANPLNENEQAQLTKMQESFAFHMASQALGITANYVALVPEFDAGISGVGASPVAKARFGGSNLSQALQAFANMVELDASIASHIGAVAGLQGGYDRRATEWRFQADQAAREQTQLDKQIIGAEIRLQIAEHELENQRTQLANSTQVDELLHSKFTNEELYDWMIRQITSVYNEAYQLAYSLAKKAQRAYEHEIGPGSDPSFIRFGYWTEARKGLLAGDLLVHDLQRMQTAYLDANVREHEMVKHVSVASLDPLALASLKELGECEVNLPEVLFDLDVPGHYFRRLKSVAMTIPCVSGPYVGVNCKLTLLESTIRTSADPGESYPTTGTTKTIQGRGDSIVTSVGQSDAGLFEANLRDERYLPFEGAGAVSRWKIELPSALETFDHDSITDVVLTLRYTARFDSDLVSDARDSVRAALNALASTIASPDGLMRAFSMRHEFPSEWHRFLYEPATSANHLEIDVSAEHFPFAVRDRLDQFVDARVIVVLADGVDGDTTAATLTQADATGAATLSLAENASFGSALVDEGAPPDAELLGTWSVDVAYDDGPTSMRVVTTDVPAPNRALDPTKIKDLILVLHYTITTG